MTQETNPNEPMQAAAEYVLGLMPVGEVQAFEAQLNRNPDLRDEVVFWTHHFVTLTDDIAPVAPPADVYGKITAQIFTSPVPAGRRWGLRRFLLGAATGLAAFAAVSMWIGPQSLTEPTAIAEIASGDGAFILAAAFAEPSGTLTVSWDEGRARDERVVELWLIAGEAAPVSLGVLVRGGPTVVTVPAELRGQVAGAVLAISDEPPGGSPTGAPTGDVLATGQVEAL